MKEKDNSHVIKTKEWKDHEGYLLQPRIRHFSCLYNVPITCFWKAFREEEIFCSFDNSSRSKISHISYLGELKCISL